MTRATHHDQPWLAKWCWTRKHLPRPWNSYAYFRKTVDLPSRATRAEIRISADARYTLFVNGRRIHHGPARSFRQHQSFDTLDITPFLEVGPNAICAILHQFGVPTFFSQYRDISGFLLDGHIELDGPSIDLHTPTNWLCRDANAWRKDVTRQSVQMGFQEHFDADADPIGWMLPDYLAKPEDGWAEPWTAGPVGCHPWLSMESRGVPLLADHIEHFTAIAAEFKGENGRGYKITPDVYHFILQEQRTRERGLIEDARSMLIDNADVTAIAPPTDSELIMAVLDPGTYRTGHIILDIAQASGDEIIDILFSEDLDKTGAPLLRNTPEEPSACEEATALRYRCRPGAQRFESFHYIGLRYATVIFRNIRAPLKVRYIGLRQVHAALEHIGSFACSDARLTQIWKVAKNTQLNCSFDAFVDCPAREQAQWWGDARIQSRVTAYAFGDFSLLERGIRQMAQSQAPDGSLHAHPPADSPGHRLPDFMMTWVGSLWDHHFHTGRTDLLGDCVPTMHRLFDFLARHQSPSNLIGGFDGFWIFLDWVNLRKDDYSATLNLLYLQSLRTAVAICDALDDPAADRYRAAADALAASIDLHFWDDAAQLWRDGFDPQANAPVEQLSQHANALAILLNLRPDTHARIARDVLLKSARARRTKIITASPFFYAYVIEAIAKAGAPVDAIDLIRNKWGAMLDRGATTFWEFWEPTASLCHAWSASPLYHLSELVLGVTPIEPGWKRVRIAPITGALESARGIIPSPLGPIRIEWEHSEADQIAARIDLPDGIEAHFITPAGERRLLESGSHEFHT